MTQPAADFRPRPQRFRTAQERRSQQTRDRLADAAIDCLIESGYRGTTFVEVCRRAGLTRGAAHHHYRDLPALLLDAMRRLNGRLEVVVPALSDVSRLEDRISVGIDVLWNLFTGAEFRAVVEIWVAQSHDAALRERIRGEMEQHSELVTTGFRRMFPELVSRNPAAVDVLRFMFVALVGAGFVNASLRPDRGEGSAQDPELRELLKRAIERELEAAAPRAPGAVA